jgi:hypothetical protein
MLRHPAAGHHQQPKKQQDGAMARSMSLRDRRTAQRVAAGPVAT